jgi:phosphoglycerate dehydrogenase-like enzyme
MSKILFSPSQTPAILDIARSLTPSGFELVVVNPGTPEFYQAAAEAEYFLGLARQMGGEFFRAAPKLKLVQLLSAGYDRVDIEAARKAGVPVSNNGGANAIAVAEHTVMLMLAVLKRVVRFHNDVVAGKWRGGDSPETRVYELAGKTLGIVGPGRTGTAVADRARALGMTVRTLGRGASADERRAFFAACDAISIHCPLTDATRGLIGAEAFAAMKPGAMLINVARGAVIDRTALAAALAAGTLSGVGLDVVWSEPWDPADPLFHDPRVVVLPHIAGSTEESFLRIAAIVWDNLDRLRRGDALLHRIA